MSRTWLASVGRPAASRLACGWAYGWACGWACGWVSILPCVLAAGLSSQAAAFDEREQTERGRSTRDVIRAELERTGASIDANTLFGKLVDRYRGLSFYQDSVKLAHRTVTRSLRGEPVPQEPARSEQSIDCRVEGTLVDVVSSVLGGGASCDVKDASPLSRIALERQLWTLPHLALRFSDEPLRSMHGRGDLGVFVPTRVEQVTIDERPLLRLHLESDRSLPVESATKQELSTLDFFVNPRSMLIERIEQSHGLGEGIRYEATLEITPNRAVGDSPAASTEGPAVAPASEPALVLPASLPAADLGPAPAPAVPSPPATDPSTAPPTAAKPSPSQDAASRPRPNAPATLPSQPSVGMS
jgi:hypothetical protein